MHILTARYRPIIVGAGLLCVLLSGALVMAAWATRDLPLLGKIIVLDPGHGGVDSGAHRQQIAEKDINLAVTQHLKKFLLQRGAVVILTRDVDRALHGECRDPSISGRHRRDLHARLETIAQSNAHAVISIHANASGDETEHGHDVYYNPANPDSKTMAALLGRELSAVTGIKRAPKKGSYYLLRGSNRPCVLVEVGFITNRQEREWLQDEAYQQRLAKAMAVAVEEFLIAAPGAHREETSRGVLNWRLITYKWNTKHPM